MSEELRLATQLELKSMVGEYKGRQRRLAAALDISPMTMNDAFRIGRISQRVMDKVLTFRQITQEELLTRHKVEISAAKKPEPVAPGTEGAMLDLAIAMLRMQWSARLDTPAREAVVRDLLGWVLREGPPELGVNTWYALLTAGQARALLALNARADYGRASTQPNEVEAVLKVG